MNRVRVLVLSLVLWACDPAPPPAPPPLPGGGVAITVSEVCSTQYSARYRFTVRPVTLGELRIWSAELPGYMHPRWIESGIAEIDVPSNQPNHATPFRLEWQAWNAPWYTVRQVTQRAEVPCP